MRSPACDCGCHMGAVQYGVQLLMGEFSMTAFRAQWSAYVDRQHRYPTGLVGQIVGERMLRQHAPETDWSIGLLQLQPTDRILEIGSGAGRGLALALAHAHQGRVTGVDRSAT